jgi:YD repeat-containing protein
LTSVRLADGTSAGLTYDAAGNILTLTDRAGKKSAFTYNAAGQVLTATNAAGGVTVYTYNSDGTLSSVRTPAGDVTTYTYDDKKRPVKMQAVDNTSASPTSAERCPHLPTMRITI